MKIDLLFRHHIKKRIWTYKAQEVKGMVENTLALIVKAVVWVLVKQDKEIISMEGFSVINLQKLHLFKKA